MAPLNFQIRSGEIAFLRDENYNTVSRIRACFLDEQSWESGIFRLDGKQYTHNELIRLIGTRIGIQIDRPDRPSDVLFDNLTALDNLSTCLLPKAGRKLIRRKMVENILDEACQWFSRKRCSSLCVNGLCRNVFVFPIINGIALTRDCSFVFSRLQVKNPPTMK